MPTDWKAMPSVGKGVMEIRLRGELEHRVLYVAKFAEAVYVLHAFEKKSQKTRNSDLATASKRLKELEQIRSAKKEI